jgi:hypothetical protein
VHELVFNKVNVTTCSTVQRVKITVKRSEKIQHLQNNFFGRVAESILCFWKWHAKYKNHTNPNIICRVFIKL